MGRPATDYIILVRPWESSIQQYASHAAFPRSDNSYMFSWRFKCVLIFPFAKKLFHVSMEASNQVCT